MNESLNMTAANRLANLLEGSAKSIDALLKKYSGRVSYKDATSVEYTFSNESDGLEFIWAAKNAGHKGFPLQPVHHGSDWEVEVEVTK